MAWSAPKIGALAEVASGNLTLAEPAGIVQGDLMVCCIGYRDAAAFAVPGDWNLVATQQSSGDADATNGIASGLMMWCVRGASAPTLTFTRTAGNVAQGRILAYSGGGGASSVFDTGTANTLGSASATVTTGTFNTAQANELIVAMVSCGDTLTTSAFDATDPATASGATDTTTAPTVGTWIERADNGTATGADHGLAIADAIRGTAGATGAIQATVSASARHVMIAASFKMEVPPTIELNTADAHDFAADTTPTLEFTGTDGNADDLRYELQVDPASTFDSGAEVVDDSYEVADIQATLQITDTNEKMAQSFLSQGGNLDSAKFLLAKIGSPTGNLRVKIYAHSGTYGTSSVPTGAALATADEVLDVTTLPATAGITWFTFNFVGAERIALIPGTHYCVAIEYDGTGTGSDTPVVGYDNSSATHGGNRSTFNSTIWNAGTNDLEFYVYTAGPLLDKVSGTDAGFLNTVSGGDTDPFNSGEKASFTVQAGEELDDGTYYWRARAKDPNGGNTWSAWATARTFLVSTNTVTTKTQLGKADIQATIARTQPGKSAVRVTATRTQLGKGNLNKTVAQTQPGRGRIHATAAGTQVGKAAIQATGTKTQAGRGRIRATTPRTQLGKSDIRKTVGQTQVGKSDIRATTPRTQLGKAAVRKSASQTQLGRGRVRIQSSATTTGKARTQKSVASTQQGRARLRVTVARTQAGKADIRATAARTQPGRSTIRATASRSQTGKASVRGTTLRTQLGVGRLQLTGAATQQGKSNISPATNTQTQTQLGQSRLGKTEAATQSGKSRLQALSTRTQAGKSRLQKVAAQTQLGVGRVTVTSDATQLGLSRLHTTAAATQTGRGRLQAAATQTQLGLARLRKSVGQVQSGISRVTVTSSSVQAGRARLRKSISSLQLGQSRVTAATARTQAGKADISAVAVRTQLGKANVSSAQMKEITGVASVRNVAVRTQTGVGRVQKVAAVTQLGKGRIGIQVSETQTGLGRVQKAVTVTQQGEARIRRSNVFNQLGVSSIRATSTQDQQGVGFLIQRSTEEQEGTARIQSFFVQTTTGRANIQATAVRIQQGRARIIAPLSASATLIRASGDKHMQSDPVLKLLSNRGVRTESK